MEISLTNSLTFDEYHAGARLARIHITGKSAQPHHRALAKSGFILLLVVLLLILASNLCFGLGIQLDRSQALLIGAGALLIGVFYLPFAERQWDRRIYKDGKWGEPIRLTLREEHLSVTLEDATEVRIPWTPFSYIENESLLVLISPNRWIIIPKRLIAPEALDHVRVTVPLSKGHSTC